MLATNFCFVLLLEFCNFFYVSAIPIYIPPIGERNFLICGILLVISLITLIGACAFCRRRKEKFEKFENEATSSDSRPEFPIFRALNSPEQNSRQPAVIVPAHSQNQSHDNLLEPDGNDNNNGPISTADLENIENNNAVDYIVTANELNCSASSNHSHQNLLSCVPAEIVNERGLIPATNFDGILLSPSPPCDGIETNSSLTSVSIFMSSDMDIDNTANFNTYNIDNELPLHQQQQQQQQTLQQHNAFEDNFVLSVDDPSSIEEPDDTGNVDVYDVNVYIEDECRMEVTSRVTAEQSNPFLDPDADAVGIDLSQESTANSQWASEAPEQCLSPESITSRTSNEFNSVEEALRCLDNAISFGDTLDEDSDAEDYDVDDDDDDDEDDDDDATLDGNVNELSIAKVLEHYLTDQAIPANKGETEILELDTTVDVNLDNKMLEETKEEVISQALALVDDVLAESLQLVELRRHQLQESHASINAKSVVDFSLNEMCATQEWLNRTEDYKGTVTDLDRCDSLENLSDDDNEDQMRLPNDLPTSTPFHTKIPALPPVREEQRRSGVKLFDEPEPINDGTFVLTPPSNETFTCANAPPIIKIDRDDTNSEDLTTQTPLNTPIELNYNIETWDKFIYKKQPYTVDDIGIANTTQTLNASAHSQIDGFGNDSSGWFLHPQNRSKFDEDTFNVTEQQFVDFAADDDEMDDGNENMNATFDQLRKQLTEMLPHAQGMASQFENFGETSCEKESSSSIDVESQEPNQHYGIKYGDLDEATNALDGLAGLIINDVGLSNDSDSGGGSNANELFINYNKRTLSPIMEESEEDVTCKTFVLNNETETRMLESTSTEVCVEEVFMGVPKALMASNDTLFNFEDTLGDGETISNSCSPRPPPVPSKKVETVTTVEQLTLKTPERPTNFGFDQMLPPPPPALCETIDILSPDQPKTENFSQEHDLTYTVDEMTCISVRDDEMISEISEPDMLSLSSGFDRANLSSLNQDDSTFVSETCARNDTTLENASGRVNESSTSIESMVMSPKDFNSPFASEAAVINQSIASTVSMSVLTPKEEEMNDTQVLDESISDRSPIPVARNFSSESTSGRLNDISTSIDSIVISSPFVSDTENGIVGSDMDISLPEVVMMNQSTTSTLSMVLSPKEEEPLVNGGNFSSEMSNDTQLLNEPIEDGGPSIVGVQESNDTNTHSTPSDSLTTDGDIVAHHQHDTAEEDTDDSLNKSITGQCRTPSISSDNDSNKENRQQQPLAVANNQAKIISFLNNEIQYSSSHYNNSNNNNYNSSFSQNSNLNQSIDGHKFNSSSGKAEHQQNRLSDSGESTTMSSVDSGLATLDSHDENMMMSHTAWSLESGGGGVGDGEDDGDIIYKEPKNVADDLKLAKIVSENMLMSTSFAVPEWDSEDDEDTNSSEEFMYVKGNNFQRATVTTLVNEEMGEGTALETPDTDDTKETKPLPERMIGDENQRVWVAHKDRVPVGTSKETPEEGSEADESSSENEGEFVPSCWDSMAQPVRSALKSPDKSNEKKRKRSVAFKIKRYHSVYEYPRESVELSPAYSEPDLWTGSDYNRHMNYLSAFAEEFKEQIDGFTITSSARPFHGSQFHAQCNTWPTDSDFSWSQYEETDLHQTSNDSEKSSSEVPSIEWPRDLAMTDGGELTSSGSPTTENDFQRPDSGVGESAELLSESPSLGDLCHAKNTLRLSLNLSPGSDSPAITEIDNSNNGANLPLVFACTEDEESVVPADDTGDNSEKLFDSILPTPSCTGSMDSLSSSSGSSDHRTLSFTTFGKKLSNNLVITTGNTNNVNENDYASTKIPSIVLIEDCEQQIGEDGVILLKKYSNNKMNRSMGARLSDSTDEDSGIENMSRVISK